ncbi:DUF3426 domain-containing protein [Pseudomonadota bacterium AL_CKDN230030165-1A_HGKHYDSX7]
MALVTRCPQCGASFKVVADQLRIRNGLVRCGACQSVFDGRACLVQPAEPVVPTLTQPADADSRTPTAPSFAPAADPQSSASRPAAVAAVEPVYSHASSPATPAPQPLPAVPPAVLRGRADMRREPAETDPDDELDDEVDHRARDVAGSPTSSSTPYVPAAPVTTDARAGRPGAEREPRLGAAAAVPPWDDEPTLSDDAPAVIRGPRRPGTGRDEPRLGDAPREPGLSGDTARHPVSRVYPEHTVSGRASAGRASAGHAEPHTAADDADLDDDLDPHATEPVLGEARTRYSSSTDSGRTPPEFLDDDRVESRRTGRRVWSLLCLLGVIALLLQLLYVYRTPLATSVPALRPVLELACKPLDCTVGYARRIERIAISASSLQPPSGAAGASEEGRSQLVLSVTLRNRFDKPQPWPALVLQLTDMSDTVVARKVLLPRDYLTPQLAGGPFAAAGEAQISVPVQVTGLQVNGYQLDKFFP